MPPASALATTSTALVVANGDPQEPTPEEDIDLPLDLSQLPMIPMQKTLLLVNNFVANTTRFLNHFAHECEERIARVSTNLTRVEIMLAILEAKLDSIPDLTVSESDIAAVDGDASPATATPGIQIDMDELPATEPEQGFVPPPPPPPPSAMDGESFTGGAPPPPPPPLPPQLPGMEGALVVAPPNGLDAPSGETPVAAPAFMKLKDDPLYAKYFTMQRLGMPEGAISQKMLMDGVDPSIMSMDPEGPTPSGATPPAAAPSDGPPPLPIAAAPGPPPPPPPPTHPDQLTMEHASLPPPPPLPPFSPTSSTSSRGHPESLFGDGPPPPPPPPGNPPLPPQSDDDDSSSDDEDISAPSEAPRGFLKLKDDPAFAKYFSMQKMGLPEGAIRHKLLMDGVTLDILSMDPEGPSPNGGAGAPAPSSAPQAGGALPPPPLPPSMPPALPPPGARPGLPPPPIPRYDDSDSDSDF